MYLLGLDYTQSSDLCSVFSCGVALVLVIIRIKHRKVPLPVRPRYVAKRSPQATNLKEEWRAKTHGGVGTWEKARDRQQARLGNRETG